MKGKKIILTEMQEIWLKNCFSDTKNAEIAQKLGIHIQSVTNLGRRYGLKKSKEHLERCQRAAAEAAKIPNSLREYHGSCIPGGKAHRYKKGESYRERYGAEADEKRKKAALDGRNKMLKREKARILFGLPQKTKIRLVRQPKAKVDFRYRLKKRGYIVDDDLRVVYYTEDTNRSKRTENWQQPYYTFEPAEMDVTKAGNLLTK